MQEWESQIRATFLACLHIVPNGIDVAVLARVHRSAIAVNNLFLLVGICGSRFQDGCNWSQAIHHR